MRPGNSREAQCAFLEMTYPGWQVAYTARPVQVRYTTVPAGFYAVHRERLGEHPVVGASSGELGRHLLERQQQRRDATRWVVRSALQPLLPVVRRPP